MKCSICENDIDVDVYGWDQGHNADPFDGRCCASCNEVVVIPARLHRLTDMTASKHTRKLLEEGKTEEARQFVKKGNAEFADRAKRGEVINLSDMIGMNETMTQDMIRREQNEKE